MPMSPEDQLQITLKDGEVLLHTFKAKVKGLFRSYPRTLFFTNKRFLQGDDCMLTSAPWELLYLKKNGIKARGKSMIINYRDLGKTRYIFKDQYEADKCVIAMCNVLKDFETWKLVTG